jgi:hypothetical protein
MVHSRFARYQALLSRLSGPRLALALLVSTLAALRLRSTLLVQLSYLSLGSIKKPHAKLIFERLYLVTQRWLSHMEQLGGARKMELLS